MWRKRILILAAALAGGAGSAGFAEPPISFPAGERQLFLDEHCIATTEYLTRTMHSPTKRGAVIRPDRPWETALQTRCAPAWDEKRRRFQLWLITSTPAPGVAGTTYAESRDGIHWVKPILRQWEYLGSRDNNFVGLDPRSEWPANAMENVVRDPDEPDPSRRYKGFLGAIRRQPIVSPDGIRWRRLEVPSIPSNDESNLTYDRPTRTFIATLKRPGPHGRSHGIWTSRDFANWTDSGVLFSADAQDQTLCRRNVRARLADPTLQPVQSEPAAYNADIYNLGIFRHEGLYVGLPAVFHASARDDGFHLIQLACSRDLRNWQRLGGRQPFIGPSPVGEDAYDLTQLLPPSGPIVRGDELWFYYTGIKYRQAGPDPKTGAVCLAVLRRDGFLSLDAGDTPGTLTTRSFTAPSGKLSVNVDAAGGSLEVTVLDASSRVVAVSKPLAGDRPRAVVRWKSGNPESSGGQPIRLRFTLRNARLYSFWYGPADASLDRSPGSTRAGMPANRSPVVHHDGAPPTALRTRE